MKGSALTKKQRIGSLDRVIAFRSATETQSASGYPWTVWATAFTDYACIEYGGFVNDESYQANAQIAETRVSFITRYNSNTSTVTTKYRIELDGNEYDIEGITEPMGRQRFLKFQCKLRK